MSWINRELKLRDNIKKTIPSLLTKFHDIMGIMFYEEAHV